MYINTAKSTQVIATNIQHVRGEIIMQFPIVELSVITN